MYFTLIQNSSIIRYSLTQCLVEIELKNPSKIVMSIK